MEPTTPTVVEPVAPTISAERDAANRGDFAALDAAALASRRGAPLPRVEAPDAPEATAPAEPGQPALTAKQLREQKNDERLRQRVAEAVAEKDAEIARLRAAQPPPAATVRSEAAPAQPTVPDWKRIAALPQAPKLADFDSVDDHSAAMAYFVHQQLQTERQSADQQRAESDAVTNTQNQRIGSFDARVTALEATEPGLAEKIIPVAKQLGSGGGPYQIVSNLALDSSVGPQTLRYFAEHPESLERLVTVPDFLRNVPLKEQVRGHIPWIIKEFGKLEAQLESSAAPPEPARAILSTITAAPPPPPTLTRAGSTSDPTAAALKRGDFAAFDHAEMQKERAKRMRA